MVSCRRGMFWQPREAVEAITDQRSSRALGSIARSGCCSKSTRATRSDLGVLDGEPPSRGVSTATIELLLHRSPSSALYGLRASIALRFQQHAYKMIVRSFPRRDVRGIHRGAIRARRRTCSSGNRDVCEASRRARAPGPSEHLGVSRQHNLLREERVSRYVRDWVASDFHPTSSTRTAFAHSRSFQAIERARRRLVRTSVPDRAVACLGSRREARRRSTGVRPESLRRHADGSRERELAASCAAGCPRRRTIANVPSTARRKHSTRSSSSDGCDVAFSSSNKLKRSTGKSRRARRRAQTCCHRWVEQRFSRTVDRDVARRSPEGARDRGLRRVA